MLMFLQYSNSLTICLEWFRPFSNGSLNKNNIWILFFFSLKRSFEIHMDESLIPDICGTCLRSLVGPSAVGVTEVGWFTALIYSFHYCTYHNTHKVFILKKLSKDLLKSHDGETENADQHSVNRKACRVLSEVEMWRRPVGQALEASLVAALWWQLSESDSWREQVSLSVSVRLTALDL